MLSTNIAMSFSKHLARGNPVEISIHPPAAFCKGKNAYSGKKNENLSKSQFVSIFLYNAGVCYLPRFAVQQELPTAAGSAAIHAVCAYHKNKWISPPMQLFLELAGRLG